LKAAGNKRGVMMRTAILGIGAGILLFSLIGCESEDPQTAFEKRQDQALRDPMNYSVDMDNTDIMGGGIGEYDAKAMQRDLDAFGNP
jgi:hypothetical protein